MREFTHAHAKNARAYDLSRIGNAKLAIFAFLWFCSSGARNAPNPNEEEKFYMLKHVSKIGIDRFYGFTAKYIF